MKMTRKQLRKIILRETKLIQEGSTSRLIVEMGEIIEAYMENQPPPRNAQIPLDMAVRILTSQSQFIAGFVQLHGRDWLREFLLETIGQGAMDFAMLSLGTNYDRKGREIDVIERYVDPDEEFDFI
tara:strand:- start:523 stop:900 length:378 start_codon:yes stop_codon:yes gene_type:complete